MKAKKKPLETRTPDDFGVTVAPRLRVIRVEEPAGRTAGIKVAGVTDLIEKLKAEAGVI